MLRANSPKRAENWRTRRKRRRRSQKLWKWYNIRSPKSISWWKRQILAVDMAAMDIIMDWCIILEEDYIKKNTVEALEVCLGGLRHPLFFLAMVLKCWHCTRYSMAGNQSRFRYRPQSHICTRKWQTATGLSFGYTFGAIEECGLRPFHSKWSERKMRWRPHCSLSVCIEYISNIGMYTETHTQLLSS